MLAVSPSSPRSRDCSSCKLRSGCSSIHSHTCRRMSAVNLLRRPRGPDGGRAQLPLRRNVADTFLAQPTLTCKRLANTGRLPSFC